MARTQRDWRAERARQRRRVERVNRSADGVRINVLLAGGEPCEVCGAYAVRYRVVEDQRICSECGHVQPRPVA